MKDTSPNRKADRRMTARSYQKPYFLQVFEGNALECSDAPDGIVVPGGVGKRTEGTTMKKVMGIVLVAGLAFAAGCEDKKAPVKAVTDAAKDAGKAAGDATKAAGDAAKGAVDTVKDKAAEGVAALRDKAVEAFKPQIDAAKAKLDELTAKVGGLDAVKKAAASPLLDTAKTAFSDLTSKFDALKGSTDGWEKAKTGVEGSMKTFTDAITKLGDIVK
jgi:hypothetical protein